MTEEMKGALDKAAKELQWSAGQILLNKDTFEPVNAATPLEKMISVPIPDKLYVATQFGVNWYLNNVWHDTITEEPEEERNLLLMFFLKDGKKTFDIGLYGKSSQKVWICQGGSFKWLKLSLYAKWAYIEDFLPITKENN